MIVVASYYVLFVATGADSSYLGAEIVAALVFATMAVLGFKRGPWWVVAALAAHGVFDFLHPAHPGVPTSWPGFCGAYDVTAAVVLGLAYRWASVTRRTNSAAWAPSSQRDTTTAS